MNPEWAINWYTIERTSEITGRSVRHLRRELPRAGNLVRIEHGGHGRPRTLYHFSSHPRLASHHMMTVRSTPGPVEPSTSDPSVPTSDIRPLTSSSGPHPADLAIGQLRLQALHEYRHRCRCMPKGEALAATAADWSRSPRTLSPIVEERLPGGHTRKTEHLCTLGEFQPRTLRDWSAAIYKEGHWLPDHEAIPLLAPDRKGKVGRNEKPIDDRLLKQVYSLCSTFVRCDVERAVEHVKLHARELAPYLDGAWPDVSIATWRRRLLQLDPDRSSMSLGRGGVGRFRAEHSPDIERDYSALPFNGLWQLDDVTEDFYASASDPAKVMRPYAYAIVRVATRQWICAVTCETPITRDQVRTLVGLAMASKDGGIPDEIQFERGTVACDDYLYDLLTTLGVKVHRTSMDGGAVAPGMAPDRATGHFQGKGVVESRIRGHHNEQWLNPISVGTDERNTAPARTEILKALAIEAAKKGEFVLVPDWQARVFAALNAQNDRKHSALPEIIDVATGDVRHMTPNEKAQQLKGEQIAVMSENLLPLFYQRGVACKVTKNGFTLATNSYGRFDEDLQGLQGQTVLAYAIADAPGLAYVVELGRCVEQFVPVAHDQAGNMVEKKRAIERPARNQYEALIAEAMARPGQVTLDAVKFMANPVPGRGRSVRESAPLAARARSIRSGVDRFRSETAARAARFDMPAGDFAPAVSARGRGLLARSDEFAGQVAAMAGSFTIPEKELIP